MTKGKSAILLILDGFGYSETSQSNAIEKAEAPVWDRLWKNNPHTLIQTSGMAVGLPEGQMGNSEVGHMNLGAGRVVMQDLPRISTAVADGSLAGIPALKALIEKAKGGGDREWE